MLQLDKKTVSEFENAGVKQLKVFFYEAGCSGNKIDMLTDFEITDELEQIKSEYLFDIYIPKTDKIHLENAKITRVVKADHTGQEQVRYIFTSEEVLDRCGCGTSFAFEKKQPKIDLDKLRKMRENFKNKNA